MNETYVVTGIKEILDTFFPISIDAAPKCAVPMPRGCFPTFSEIPISRVTYSGDTTVVLFTDGTKTTVKCSKADKYDRQTAIAYALVKRMFGKVGRWDAKAKKLYENEIDGNGFGTKLEKIAAAGLDQDEEKRTLKARKAKAQEEHKARQKRESETAWKKRVAKRAEEIKLEREAMALVDSLKNPKKILVESAEDLHGSFGDWKLEMDSEKGTVQTSKPGQRDPKDAWKWYQKPNKPFSQFTNEEKKEYWRYHNKKRRAEGKR